MIYSQTNKHKTLQEVIQLVQNGWPSTKKEIQDQDVLSFFYRLDSLSIVKECLMFATVNPFKEALGRSYVY